MLGLVCYIVCARKERILLLLALSMCMCVCWGQDSLEILSARNVVGVSEGLEIVSATAHNELCYNRLVEHEKVLHISYGGLWQQDQYLSPLLYSGQCIGIGNEWWQGFCCDTSSHWRHVGRIDGRFGWTYNTVGTNLMYSLGIDVGWGAYYSWRFRTGIELLLGPYLEADWMGKMHGNSVNKPYSMDVAIDLCAMGGVGWSFAGRRTSYRLRYIVRANMVGMDFIPDYWQSYYELSEGVQGKIRCSSMANHRMLRHGVTLDMQLLHSTWRVGVAHEYLEYGERDMMFSREDVYAVIGCIWHYKIRSAKDMTIWEL